MKKYTLPIILLAVSFSISLSGCQKQEGKSTEQNRIEAGNTQTVQPETRSTGRITGTGRGGKGSGRTYRSRYFRGKFRGEGVVL